MKRVFEIYIKNLKSRKLPEIKEETWSRFLSLWKSEESNYQTEAQKLSVLRDRMTVPSDKSSTESMESLEDVLTFLYNRYGSPNAIMQDNLDSLETLSSPGSDTKLEKTWSLSRLSFRSARRTLNYHLSGQLPGPAELSTKASARP
jgi:hypothetical protein